MADQMKPTSATEQEFGQTTSRIPVPNGNAAQMRAQHWDLHNPMAFIHTRDDEPRLPAFGGEFQPGLYKSVKARKFANPAPLGLSAFALTTFVLSAVNLGVRGVSAPNIAVPLAFVTLWKNLDAEPSGYCVMNAPESFSFSCLSNDWPVIMGWTKDQMIEEMQEAREELEQALGDIEAYGERFEWCVIALLLSAVIVVSPRYLPGWNRGTDSQPPLYSARAPDAIR
ncbi:GPR1/FUN34/yaaH family-domain-containing protein [Cercophora newfieldiana]|uniref:GPR1/FUN34/yaaH family-domain-containing protein n=1 Tax=Cercophora newfieldiana TaxID=92897 RepID=A0AA39YMQ3_9PEZI|nr:GPR1/FUN34/yaaH family-domain-containing protein [Cercophora newfieldiana]